MPQLTLKPTHKSVVNYYDNLKKFEKLGIKYESAVRSAFQELLKTCAQRERGLASKRVISEQVGKNERENP